MTALEVKKVIKTYPNNVQALKGISLKVKKGDFFALLGPNGAGKSTLIGIITHLVTKDSGNVKIFGHDIDIQINEAKSCIGVVPQEFNFNIFETVEQIIINQAGYYGISRKNAFARCEKQIKQLGLWEKRHTQSMQLSGGLKRRLMIARALVHDPNLLILDEPTAGVDIELRRSMWDFLIELNERGVTIILTTHYLEEAESLCKNIAIINQGEIVTNTGIKQLLNKLDIQTFVLNTNKKIIELPQIKGYKLSKVDDTTLEVELKRNQKVNHFFEKLDPYKINILSMRNKVNRLEELFVRLLKDHNQIK